MHFNTRSFSVAALLFVCFGGFKIAEAQVWPAGEEGLKQCLEARDAPFYRPTIQRPLRLTKEKGEELQGLPADGCVDMILPESRGKRGWVKQAKGDNYVYRDGKIVRRADCQNDSFAFVPYPPLPLPEKVVERIIQEVPVQPAQPTPEPAKPSLPPPPPPSPPPPVLPRPRFLNGIRVDAGVGILGGRVNTNYQYPNPSAGDVPQRNGFWAPILGVRAESESGPFGFAAFTVAGEASETRFQNITGTWIDKIRVRDDSRDKILSLSGGWKFPLGDLVSAGPTLNFDWMCLCEEYFAQNTDTKSKRSFRGLGVGVELSTRPMDLLVVRANGLLGLTGRREHWTKQRYTGPGGPIDFPRWDASEETARLNRLGAEAQFKITGPLNAVAGIQWLQWRSNRPTTFPAKEHTSTLGLNVGVRFIR